MIEAPVLRRRFVRQLTQRGVIASESVRHAFAVVPREVFVPEAAASRGLEAVYSDEVFVTKTDSLGQAVSSSSQPGIMGPMLEQLQLEPGHRVLEIGAGTGYNAALLTSIVGGRGRVTSLEIDGDTARRARRALRSAGLAARVVHTDGRKGWPQGAPYDRIIVTASASEIPRAWRDQLVDGGLVQLPVRLRTETWGPQLVVTFERDGRLLRAVRCVPGGFMVMRDADGADCPTWDRVAMQTWVRGQSEVVDVSGRVVGRMGEAARRRLAAALAGRPRTRLVYRGVHDRAGGLRIFVALAAGRARLGDASGWWGVALVEPTGTSVAALAAPSEPRSAAQVRLQAWGGLGAERELVGLVGDWRSAGRPSWRDLRIIATFGRRPAGAWRTSKRGASYLAFDWVPGSELDPAPPPC